MNIRLSRATLVILKYAISGENKCPSLYHRVNKAYERTFGYFPHLLDGLRESACVELTKDEYEHLVKLIHTRYSGASTIIETEECNEILSELQSKQTLFN